MGQNSRAAWVTAYSLEPFRSLLGLQPSLHRAGRHWLISMLRGSYWQETSFITTLPWDCPWDYSNILKTWHLASSKLSDLRESAVEAVMSFMTYLWKLHTIISMTSYWLLWSTLCSVARSTQRQVYQEHQGSSVVISEAGYHLLSFYHITVFYL